MLNIKRAETDLLADEGAMIEDQADSFDIVDESGVSVLRIQGDVARRIYSLMRLEKRIWRYDNGNLVNMDSRRIHHQFNCHAAVYKVCGNLKEKKAKDMNRLRNFVFNEGMLEGKDVSDENVVKSVMEKNDYKLWDYMGEPFCFHEGVTLYDCEDYFKTLTDFPSYFQVFEDNGVHPLHSGVILGFGTDGSPVVFEKMGKDFFPFRIVSWDESVKAYKEPCNMSSFWCWKGKLGFGEPEVR